MKVVEANMEAIKKAYLKMKSEWNILDVGGGDQPIRLATHVIDIQPFNEEGRTGVMGRPTEKPRFTKETWTQMNMCDGKWPFPDKFFDFVWCTQTLEDVRDPIFVCKEMMRVGKAGYINTPRKASELVSGMNEEAYAQYYNGFWHHKWLVDTQGDKLIFESKNSYAACIKWADQDFVDILNKNPKLGYLELYWKDKIEAEEKFTLKSGDAFMELKVFCEELKRNNGG